MNALPFHLEATIDSVFEHARREGLRGSHVRSPRVWFGGRLTIMTLGTAAQAVRRSLSSQGWASASPPLASDHHPRCWRRSPPHRPPGQPRPHTTAPGSPETGDLLGSSRRLVPAPAYPPQRPDQPDVPHGMRELRPAPRLEVWQQIQVAAVVGPVSPPAGRHHTEGVAAPAERARDEVRRVDRAIGTAHDARPAGDRRALSIRGGHRRRSLQRLRSSWLCLAAQGRAAAQRCALHRFSSQVVVTRARRRSDCESLAVRQIAAEPLEPGSRATDRASGEIVLRGRTSVQVACSNRSKGSVWIAFRLN